MNENSALEYITPVAFSRQFFLFFFFFPVPYCYHWKPGTIKLFQERSLLLGSEIVEGILEELVERY